MLNFIKKYRYYIVVSILIVIACIALTPNYLQNDTYYLIKIGDDLLKNGIDFKDHYTWVAELSYTYPHFLYNIFLALIYNHFSFLGIYISNIVFFIILSFSLFYTLSKNVPNKTIRTIALAIIICAIYPYITARSQTITYILFVWQIYFIQRLLQCGKKKYAIPLVIFSWLTAMTHAIVWPFVFILYLPFICEQLIAKIAKSNIKIKGFISKTTITQSPYFKTLLITLAISLLMGLLTPSRICYTAMFRIMLGETQSYIAEHSMLRLLSAGDIYIFILGMALLSFIFSKARAKLSNLFLFAGITFMSFYAVRNLALFYIICIPLTAIYLDKAIHECDQKFLEAFNLPKKVKTFAIVAAFIIMSTILVPSAIKNFNANPHIDNIACQGAVDYIKNNLDINEIKLYNHYNFGSYLLFNDIPVFMDSRANIYTPQFNGEKDIFGDYRKIEDGDYEELSNQYGITHFLIYKDSELSKILNKDQNYSQLYADDNFVLFAKN